MYDLVVKETTVCSVCVFCGGLSLSSFSLSLFLVLPLVLPWEAHKSLSHSNFFHKKGQRHSTSTEEKKIFSSASLKNFRGPTSPLSIVATTRRLPSDSGAFADWVASSSAGDLSLGFNAGPSAAAPPNPSPWSSAGRHINCALPPEFYFVAPASSFHHHPDAAPNFDPHSLNGVGVIPLLTATPCLAPTSIADGGGMQLWQSQQPHNLGGSGGAGSSSVGTTTCQDCGNQAKKDCSHRRCRTCCKSRGYDCATHVKSTWVPAARRRERQLMGGTTPTAGSSQSTSGVKKPRVGGASQTTTASHTSTSNTTPPRSFDTTSSHQDASFKDSLPGQVRAPAVFKCVRVTAVDDGDDEYAYQAVVRIGGHIFKGFLYDQGVEGREGIPNISDLHLGGGGGRQQHVLDPSDMYPNGGGGGGGSSYANQIN